MKRPKNYGMMLARYEFLKTQKDESMSKEDLAVVMIVEFQKAIDSGIRHINPEDGTVLENVEDILEVLMEQGRITIEPPDNFKYERNGSEWLNLSNLMR